MKACNVHWSGIEGASGLIQSAIRQLQSSSGIGCAVQLKARPIEPSGIIGGREGGRYVQELMFWVEVEPPVPPVKPT